MEDFERFPEETIDPLMFPYDLQISLHSFLGFGSALLLGYSVSQICKLWLAGSKISNRKRVFLSIMMLLFVRFVWFCLSGFEWFKLSSRASVVGEGGILVYIFYLSSLVMRFLYLYPLALVFRASCWLLLNWFELYHKEKLRKKLPRLIRRTSSGEINTSPKERRSKAHQRQKDLNRLSKRLVTIINAVAVIAGMIWWLGACFHDLLDQSSLFSEWLAYSSSGTLPPVVETLVALCCFGCLLYICHTSFLRLANLLLARASHSYKLKRHNLLTLGLSLSALIYFFVIVLFFIIGPSADSEPSQFGRYHLYMRVWELLHCALVLRLLGSPSLSLKAPFPAETKAITQDWLTSVLHENGHLRRGVSVAAFWSENLKGGCHFKVSRVNLRYSKEKSGAPKTVVVKVLYWDKPILERLLLLFKYLLKFEDDREVMYLKSYQMEHRFYKRQVHDAEHGLKIPQIYYNLEDVFNNRFGMVCQDLSALEDGQPHGFNVSDCEIFLQHLAQFHAAHWGAEEGDDQEQFRGWNEAGYWTGDKREATKNKVAEGWVDCWSNFPDLNLKTEYPHLGQMLLDRLDFVRAEFLKSRAREYRTLCHGDFKISNLFIGNLATALLRRAQQPASLLHQSSFSDFAALRPPVSASEVSTSEVSDDPDSSDPVDFESRDVYTIDWQWFGLGNCSIDVAPFLVTTPHAQSLSRIDHLLDVYYKALSHHLSPKYIYPPELFRHHFNVALVDYCTYCIAAKWSKMTPEDFANNARKVHDGLHLRSFHHMAVIIHRTDQILREWQVSYPLTPK